VPINALKTAPKVIGAKQVAKAVEKGVAGLVYLAEDADIRVTTPVRELCSRAGVAIKAVPSMAELGRACGIEVGAAAVALIKLEG